MRICYLADAPSVHTRNWLRYFVEEGHEVHLISFRDGDLAGAAVHSTKLPCLPSRIGYLVVLPWIRRILDRIDPQIVHSHYVSSYGFVGAMTRRHPFVVTAHGSDVLVGPAESRLRRFFVRHAFHRADLVHSVAQHMTEKMTTMGVSPEKIVTFQYGLDLSRFPLPAAQASDRDGPVVASTRALEPIYRVDVLVKAAAKIRSTCPGARFLVAGEGTEEDTCRRLATDSHLDGAMRFLGFIPNEHIPALLRGSHVYVSCSVSDGTPISLLEAMASGSFPVVTDIPANREWIVDGHNGFLVPVGDADALAMRVLDAWQNRDLRHSASLVNRDIVEERADWHKNMAMMEGYYRRLVTRKRGSERKTQ